MSVAELAADDELEAIGALGALAQAASSAREARGYHGTSLTSDIKFRGKHSPNQKWVQCAKCNKWRQVPYTVTDDQLGDDWECKSNVWDPPRSTCDAPQTLSNEAIDEILAAQNDAPHADMHDGPAGEEPMYDDMDAEYEDDHGYEGGEEGYEEGGEEGVEDEDEAADVSEEVRRIMRASKARRSSQMLPRRYEGGADPMAYSYGGRGMRGRGSNGGGPPGAGRSASRGGARAVARRSMAPAPRSMVLPPLPQSALMGQQQQMQQQTQPPPQLQSTQLQQQTQHPMLQQAMPQQTVRRGGGRGSRGGRSRGPRTFPRPGNRSGMDEEAAQVLVGLTTAGVGMDMPMAPEHPPAAAEVGQLMDFSLLAPATTARRPEYPYPKATLAPGRVVWAKVEGHDWWPAKVVRRRAVPKEVGPPPGGQAFVLLYIPVVFFTADGIPGEVDEQPDTTDGILAASMRALSAANREKQASAANGGAPVGGGGGGGAAGESDEAEFAWLPLDCIKPFRLGDVSGAEGVHVASGDPALMASIQEAEAAVRAAATDGSDLGDSDSDGGWGLPVQRPPPPGSFRMRGRGRGKAGRRGRGGRSARRGGRGGRGARGGYGDEDYSDAEAVETPAVANDSGPAANSRPVVQGILGWRPPLTDQQKAEEREKQQAETAERLRILENLQRQRRGGLGQPTRATKQVAEQPAQPTGPVSTGGAAPDITAHVMQSPVKAEAPHTAPNSHGQITLEPGQATAVATTPAHPPHTHQVPAGTLPGIGVAVPVSVAAGPHATAAYPDPMSHGREGAPQLPPLPAHVHPMVSSAGGALPPIGMMSPLYGSVGGAPLQGGLLPPGIPGLQDIAPGGMGQPMDLGGMLQAPLPVEDPFAPEFLVKWVGKSHVHNVWVKENVLLTIAKRKLLNFKKKHGDEPCNFQLPEWTVPERFVARRPSPAGPGWEVLVKWTKLGYEHATWEAEGQGVLIQPEYLPLHEDMWARQAQALAKASPARQQQAAMMRAAARASLQDVGQEGQGQQGSTALQPHQLQVVNVLRRMWAMGKHTIMVDEPGLGKTATVMAYLQSVLWEFQAAAPILVIVPASQLEHWEAEWRFWAGQGSASAKLQPSAVGKADGSGAEAQQARNTSGTTTMTASGLVRRGPCNLLVYSGCSAARSILHDHELWMNPSSMDSKTKAVRHKSMSGIPGPHQLPKPDVVLASYEAVVADQGSLSSITWETMVLDMRQRSRSVQLPKAHVTLMDLRCRHRLMVLDGQLPSLRSPDDLLALLGFVHQPRSETAPPSSQPLLELDAVLGEGAAALPAEEAAVQLHALLQPHATPAFGTALYQSPPIRHEVLVPVHLSGQQVEAYKTVLARHYEVLTDPKPPRHSGHRAAQLRHICNELRKVCTHPWLLPEFEPEEPSTSSVGSATTPAGAGKAFSTGEAPEDQPMTATGAVEQAQGAVAGAAEEAAGSPAGKAAAQNHQRVASSVLQSGKLQALELLLGLLHERRKLPLVLSQSNKVLEVIATWARDKLGQDAVLLLDLWAPTDTLHEQLRQLNALSTEQSSPSPVRLVLTTARACGLGTHLPSVGAVVVFDSDWHPLLDIQVVRRARQLGPSSPRRVPVLRLVTTQTVEEKLVGLADAVVSSSHALVTIFQAGPHTRTSVAGMRMLEGILRHGAEQVFASTAGGEAGQDGMAVDKAAGDAHAPSAVAVAPGQVALGMEQMAWLLEQAEQAVAPVVGAVAADAAEVSACSTGPLPVGEAEAGVVGGRTFTARVWSESLQAVEAAMMVEVGGADEHGAAGAGGGEGDMDVDGEGGGGEAGTADEDDGRVGGTSMGGSRGGEGGAGQHVQWWDGLLAAKWTALLKEDEEAAAAGGKGAMGHEHLMDRDNGGLDDEGPSVDKEGLAGDDDEGSDDFADTRSHAQLRLTASGQVPLEHGGSYSLDDGRRGRGGRGGRGSGAGMGASGGGKQPGTARAGRGRSRKRAEEEDGYPHSMGGGYGQGYLHPQGGYGSGPGTHPGAGQVQAHHGPQHSSRGGNAPLPNGTPLNDRSNKRRRRVDEDAMAAGGQGGVLGMAGGAGVGVGRASPRSVRDILVREVARMDTIKGLIADASTIEHGIAQRAYTRLKTLAQELDLTAETLPGILDMARQVADILLMMRHDDDTPSDFHDYTLVAVVAVAAHLMKAGLGENYGLTRLAERHGHDLVALDQVFWHILTRLSYYRELHVRSQQLAEEQSLSTLGASQAANQTHGADKRDQSGGGALQQAHPQQAAGQQQQQQVVVSEVDSFSARLNSILTTDMSQVVYQAVSQENIPLGPLATLMPLLQMAGVLNDGAIKNALKVVRECQEQLVVLDRSHSIKVQHIQKEYQEFMERVRAKAQAAIDTANRDFQGSKTMLTSKMNLMVDYLQSQIPLQQLQHAAQQIHRAAQVASQQQLGGAGGAHAEGGEGPGVAVAARALSLESAALLAAASGDPSKLVGLGSAAAQELAAVAAAAAAVVGSHTGAAVPAAAAAGGSQPQQPVAQQGTSAGGGGTASATSAGGASVAAAAAPAAHPVAVAPPTATLQDLFRAVMYGHVALDAIPEPLKGQIALMLHPDRTRPLGLAAAEQIMAAVSAHQQQQQVALVGQSGLAMGRTESGRLVHAGPLSAAPSPTGVAAAAAAAAQQAALRPVGTPIAPGAQPVPAASPTSSGAAAMAKKAAGAAVTSANSNAPSKPQVTPAAMAAAAAVAAAAAQGVAHLPISAAAYQAILQQQQQRQAGPPPALVSMNSGGGGRSHAGDTASPQDLGVLAPVSTGVTKASAAGGLPSPSHGPASAIIRQSSITQSTMNNGSVVWGPPPTIVATATRPASTHTVTTGPGPTGSIITTSQAATPPPPTPPQAQLPAMEVGAPTLDPPSNTLKQGVVVTEGPPPRNTASASPTLPPMPVPPPAPSILLPPSRPSSAGPAASPGPVATASISIATHDTQAAVPVPPQASSQSMPQDGNTPQVAVPPSSLDALSVMPISHGQVTVPPAAEPTAAQVDVNIQPHPVVVLPPPSTQVTQPPVPAAAPATGNMDIQPLTQAVTESAPKPAATSPIPAPVTAPHAVSQPSKPPQPITTHVTPEPPTPMDVDTQPPPPPAAPALAKQLVAIPDLVTAPPPQAQAAPQATAAQLPATSALDSDEEQQAFAQAMSQATAGW